MLEPASGVRVALTPLLVQNVLETPGDLGRDEQISQGDAVANKVCVRCEVLLEDVKDPEGVRLGLVHTGLNVGILANEGTEPVAEVDEHLHVREGHPSDNGGVFLLVLAEERLQSSSVSRSSDWKFVKHSTRQGLLDSDSS